MRVAIAQVNSGPDPEDNLRLVREWTARAADTGADLVVFPEAMMRRFGLPLREVAEPVDGPWADGVRAVARESGRTLAVGMFTPAPDGRVRNTLLLTGPDVDAAYDKIHLYDAFGYRESDTVAPGTEPVTATVAGVRIGLATCYDVRFPGLFTRLARQGAQVVVLCASWGDGPGKLDQWRLLTRARALDSTTFVVACGQASPPDGTGAGSAPTGIGHSVVVSPWGRSLAEAGPQARLIDVEIDPDEVARARAAIPVLADARL
ncbi:carbon-nitrogen hydrolase family protein [Microbispora sp. NPDC046933]|uniref:carbon-nitrogen hydrolase family protein n=1 Tax=Microbispora sp. NPDC046933 TaxID=3155618 RepID=UPI0033FC045F